MSMRKRFRAKRSALKKRHNEQIKKTGSGRFPTIFLPDKIPTGREFFKCSEGEHIIDIVPFEVGSQMPVDKNGNQLEEGELHYLIDIHVHQNIGNTNLPFVCPWENFGEPCPICSFIKMQRLDKKDWQALRPKRRSIYLIWCHDTPEQEKKGLQIFDAAYFFMEEQLDEIAKLPRGGGSIPFSDIDDGMSLVWSRKGSGKENTKYLGHKFIEREIEIPDRICDQAFPLDEAIQMNPDPEVMKKAMNETLVARGLLNQTPEHDENYTGDDVPMDWEDEKPKRRKPARRRKKPAEKPARRPRKPAEKPARRPSRKSTRENSKPKRTAKRTTRRTMRKKARR